MDTNIDQLDHSQLFAKLWQEKYQPAINGQLQREAERRAEAFANVPVTVCDEELRLMTPRDLLMLDGLENPFVTNQRLPAREDVAFFLWTMSKNNVGHGIRQSWRKGRLYGRILDENRDLALDIAEIELYCERVFIGIESSAAPKEETKGLEKKPPQVYFLAPILVRVGAKLGAYDPMDGKLLADTPVPRLLQYQKAIDADNPDLQGTEFTEFDSARSRCLEEVNQLIAARGQQTA